jgi:hypothetical protein
MSLIKIWQTINSSGTDMKMVEVKPKMSEGGHLQFTITLPFITN